MSWKPSGIIQSEPEGLRIRGADTVNLNLRVGEDELRCPSSNSEAEKKEGGIIPPSSVFYSIQAFNKLDDDQPLCGG